MGKSLEKDSAKTNRLKKDKYKGWAERQVRFILQKMENIVRSRKSGLKWKGEKLTIKTCPDLAKTLINLAGIQTKMCLKLYFINDYEVRMSEKTMVEHQYYRQFLQVKVNLQIQNEEALYEEKGMMRQIIKQITKDQVWQFARDVCSQDKKHPLPRQCQQEFVQKILEFRDYLVLNKKDQPIERGSYSKEERLERRSANGKKEKLTQKKKKKQRQKKDDQNLLPSTMSELNSSQPINQRIPLLISNRQNKAQTLPKLLGDQQQIQRGKQEISNISQSNEIGPFRNSIEGSSDKILTNIQLIKNMGVLGSFTQKDHTNCEMSKIIQNRSERLKKDEMNQKFNDEPLEQDAQSQLEAKIELNGQLNDQEGAQSGRVISADIYNDFNIGIYFD